MILLQLIPKLSFAVFQKLSLAAILDFLDQGDLQMKNQLSHWIVYLLISRI